MINKKYAKKFTEYQINQFDIHFKKVMKERLMSFYTYLLYMHEEEQQVKMSIDELSDRWNNKYKKKAKKEKCVCRATIYNWIKKLEEVKLLCIDKDSADTFIYTIIYAEIFLDKKLDKKIDGEKSRSTIENTEFYIDEICDNTKSLKDNLDIDSNTASTVSPVAPTSAALTKLNFDKYSEKCTWEYAINVIENVFVDLNVKSSLVKGIVIDKVEKYYWNISKCGAVNYIAKLVNQVQAQCKKNFEEKCLYNSYSNTKTNTFCAYEQRTYNFEELEKDLLGW